jgi:polysaccharide biosynthesis protein PslH
MRVLFVTPYVPSLIRVRPYNLIRSLAQLGHSISLVALTVGDEVSEVAGIRPYCHRCELVTLRPRQMAGNLLSALTGRVPLQAAYGHSRAMIDRIGRLLRDEPVDVAHVEHLRASMLGRALVGIPRVFDSVDCISLLLERASRGSPQIGSRLVARLELGRTRTYEGRLLSLYQRVLVTSSEDRQALLTLMEREGAVGACERLVLLPNGVDLEYFSPPPFRREPERLVFTGKMSYHANVASALFLAREVMPRVWWRRPKVSLWIVGKDPPPAVRALAADPRVTVTGYVPDMRPYLAGATVAACPIAYGVGIQNKVLEAMAMGTPVITSPRVQMALGVTSGVHLLIADRPSPFAEQVLRLLSDAALRARLSDAGRRYVVGNHHWPTIAARLAGVYAEAGDCPGA